MRQAVMLAAFVAAVLAVLATSAAAAACLARDSLVSFALAVYLLASAEIVFLTELLSLGRWIGATGYAVGEAALFAAAATAWLRLQRPRPRRPCVAWREAACRHPIVTMLAVAILCAVAYQAFLVFATPPNNWDSMTYHLPRAVEWYQRGRIEYVPRAFTGRTNAMQPNAEMQIAYTFAFLHRDTAAAVPQLLAELALLVAVFGISRRVGFSRAGAAFAALMTATLSEFALESVTTQNDVVVAALAAAAAYFLLGRTRVDTAIAGLAIGLALGTKLTVAFALPTLGLLCLAAGARRHLVGAAAAAAVCFAVFGAYGYVLNAEHTGHVLGTDPSMREWRAAWSVGGTLTRSGEIAYRFLDVSGYHQLVATRATRSTLSVLNVPLTVVQPPYGKRFTHVVNDAADEDLSFFGPLGFLLVLPVAAAVLVGFSRRRQRPVRAALAASIPLYVIGLAAVYVYNAWIGRYLITPVALTMPLAAAVYRLRVLAAVAAVVGVATLALAHGYNHAKPTGLSGTAPVWTLSRPEAQARKGTALASAIAAVDRQVPASARLGAVLGRDDWSYPLYGPSLSRRLVPLAGPDPIEEAEVLGLRWVLSARPVRRSPRGWTTRRLGESGWTLESRPPHEG